ncbi:MAG: DUF1080 domain-containing protein [Planctomycetia bacterium]|nr:DUF1080 domain-containing protein [Planctomycetia bacterium]
MKRQIQLSLLISFIATIMIPLSLFAQDSEDGFVSIFNGKDLSGWVGDERIWSVQDGAIVGTTDNESKKLTYNTFLAYQENLSDFIVRFDIRLSKEGNSGLNYRSWILDNGNAYQLGGYQADFDGQANYSGIMYGEQFRGILAQTGTISRIGNNHQPEEMTRFATAEEIRENVNIENWNSYEIIARGFVFIHKINGKITSVCIDEDNEARRPNGILAIQAHVGPPMKVEVKNIRLKKL